MKINHLLLLTFFLSQTAPLEAMDEEKPKTSTVSSRLAPLVSDTIEQLRSPNQEFVRQKGEDLDWYVLRLMGESPTPNSLHLIKPGELGLFCEKNRLYCKVYNKEKMQIIRSDNYTVRGLASDNFDRILGTIQDSINIEHFSVALQQEEEIEQSLSTHNYYEAYKSMTVWDRYALLQYTSLCGYTHDEIFQLEGLKHEPFKERSHPTQQDQNVTKNNTQTLGTQMLGNIHSVQPLINSMVNLSVSKDDSNLALKTHSNEKAHNDEGREINRQPTEHGGPVVIDGYNGWNSNSFNGAMGAHGNPGAGGAGGVHGRHCQGTYETGRTTQVAYQATSWTTKEEAYEVTRWVTHEKPVVHTLSTIEFLQNLWVGPSVPFNLTFLKHITDLPKDFLSWTETEAIQKPIIEKTYRTIMVPVIQTHYGTVPLPDVWHIQQGLQVRRGSSSSGSSGNNSNTNDQQSPMVQTDLNREDILSLYKAYYQQAMMTPGIANFVKPFPNL